ncbi:DUF2807 domain-containing protein [Flavihumibacter sp. R14]|nr:DUF2807 domain-containing protein [Flavihumibacter soli]
MKISVLSISLIAAGLFFSGCNRFGCIEGSGRQISSNRNVEPFTFIETGGSVKLVLKQGPQSLKIVADDNIMEKIRTRVHGNTLTIDMDGNFCNSGPIVVYLSSKGYEGIDASGAVEIVSDGKLQVNDFEMELSGSSKVDIDLNAANVRTSSSGSSEIAIKGQASTHEVDLSGSAAIKALDFVVGKYRIESSGASESKINVLNELSVKSSGSSDVEYRGNPSKVHSDDSGASSLRKIN